MGLGQRPTITVMRWCSLLILMLLLGCESQPILPEDEGFGHLPKVTNIRPDFPADKAVLMVQTESTFMHTNADLTEAWSMVTNEGLSEQQIHIMKANAIRVGTMDAAAVSLFYSKLPRTGGTRVKTIGVGREPVIFETTPTIERSIEVEAMLGIDRDETLKLPPGRMQFLLDVVIDGDKVMMSVTPHHHWVSPSIKPRTPEEKAMEGREFREISLDANLSGDRFLVLGWGKREERQEPKEPEELKEQKEPEALPASTRLGDLLFVGQRADRPLQLICIIRVPPQGEMFGNQLARPER